MKKKYIRLILLIMIITGVIIFLCKSLQPDIKNYLWDDVSVIVYDNDDVDSRKLQLIDCDFYKTTAGYRELTFNANQLDTDKNYGKSFVVSIPVGFTRKNKDDDFELYYKVNIPKEAQEYIYVINNHYVESVAKEPHLNYRKQGRLSVDLYGCTCGLDDEELFNAIKDVSVLVEIVDSNGDKWEDEIPLDMKKLTIAHDKLEEASEGPFFVVENWIS